MLNINQDPVCSDNQTEQLELNKQVAFFYFFSFFSVELHINFFGNNRTLCYLCLVLMGCFIQSCYMGSSGTCSAVKICCLQLKLQRGHTQSNVILKKVIFYTKDTPLQLRGQTYNLDKARQGLMIITFVQEVK